MPDQKPNQKTHLNVVVIGPSDTEAERKATKEVLEEINTGLANAKGVHLDFRHWTKDVYPGLHWWGGQGSDELEIDWDE